MKKVLALVLAVMMLSTMGFAATYKPAVTDSGKEFAGSFTGTVWGNTNPVRVNPGDKIAINKTALTTIFKDASKRVKEVNSDNYYITSTKYNEGRDLIAGVAFNDDDDQVEVKFNKNYKLTKAKDYDVEFILKGKGRTKPESVKIRLTGTVSNTVVDKDHAVDATYESVSIVKADDAIKIANAQSNTIYKFGAIGTDKYATLELTAADTDVEISVRVYDGNKFYLHSNQDADSDVLKKYADTDADLTFLNFPGTPEFDATAEIRIYKDEGTYIYQNKGNGALAPITAASAGAAGQTAGNVKWDDDEGCYILKARKVESMVFSDKKLAVSATATGTGNPDTGANDVVGIATALAVVALVSAAAVSLKK